MRLKFTLASTLLVNWMLSFVALASEEQWIETHHFLSNGAEDISYHAYVGTFPLVDSADKPAASLGFIAYEKEHADKSRPITFVFNGGPGSASVWLHMGAFGPKRVDLDDTESFDPSKLSLASNESSLLAFTDLVFIDPVETGFSRKIADSNEEYFSPEDDAKSVANFIRLYTTKRNRWLSPKYIAGESYGTTRSVLVADILHNDHLLSVSGLILISSVLDFNTIRYGGNQNLLPYALILPSLCATAWYHQKLGGNLQKQPIEELMELAKDFVLEEYLPFLYRFGLTTSPEDEEAMAVKLAGFIGLPSSFIRINKFMISQDKFRKKLLLDDEGLIVGRFSGTFKGESIDDSNSYPMYDPSSDLIDGAFKAGIEYYLHEDLGVDDIKDYRIFGDSVWKNWDWSKFSPHGYVSVSEELRALMLKSPKLKVFVANGYYDLATPFFATEYTFSKFRLKAKQQERIKMAYYKGGHMMYTNASQRLKLRNDLQMFFATP